MPKGYPKNPPRPPKAWRVSVYLPPKHRVIAGQIDNLSNFIQIALEQAPDIMAWAILKGYDAKKYKVRGKLDDVIDEYNDKYPRDLEIKRKQGLWPKPSQPPPEIW